MEIVIISSYEYYFPPIKSSLLQCCGHSTWWITSHTKCSSNCLQFKTVLHIVIQTVLHNYYVHAIITESEDLVLIRFQCFINIHFIWRCCLEIWSLMLLYWFQVTKRIWRENIYFFIFNPENSWIWAGFYFWRDPLEFQMPFRDFKIIIQKLLLILLICL